MQHCSTVQHWGILELQTSLLNLSLWFEFDTPLNIELRDESQCSQIFCFINCALLLWGMGIFNECNILLPTGSLLIYHIGYYQTLSDTLLYFYYDLLNIGQVLQPKCVSFYCYLIGLTHLAHNCEEGLHHYLLWYNYHYLSIKASPEL